MNFDDNEEILNEIYHLQKKYQSILDHLISLTKEIYALKEQYKDLYKCCEENEIQIAKLKKNVGYSDII